MEFKKIIVFLLCSLIIVLSSNIDLIANANDMISIPNSDDKNKSYETDSNYGITSDESIEEYTPVNYIPLKNDKVRVCYGVTYTYNNGYYHISGTPKKSSYLNLYGSTSSVPKGLYEGAKLKFSFSSGSNYITLGIRGFNEEYPDGTWIMKTKENTEFTVPDLSIYDGVSIRITVTQSSQNFDKYVYPVIENLDSSKNFLPKDEYLNRKAYGVEFDYKDGKCNIKGTPEKSFYLNLYGSKTSVPQILNKGDRLKFSFDSKTNYITFGLRGFNKDYPDGTWIMKTTKNTEFTIPDLSIYDGVSIRITITACDKYFDTDVFPTIEKLKPKQYLTIIDDDGDKHFISDVLPLIEELNVPISSAVSIARIASEPRWMNWDEILTCQQSGAEILCHTYYHYSGDQIPSIDDQTILQNYTNARDELKARGFEGAEYLVYSSSTGNYKRVQNVASQVFKCGIKIGGTTINDEKSDIFALSRYRIDYASTEGREDWNKNDMRSFIDELSSKGGWQIWMFHSSKATWRQRVELDENGDVLLKNGLPVPMVNKYGKPVYDIDGSYPTIGSTMYIPMLREAILYAKENNIEIITVKNGYEKFYNQN